MSIHFNGATSQYCSSVSVASSAFVIPAGSSISGYEAISTGQEAPENTHIARVPAIVKRVFNSLVRGAEWMAQEAAIMAVIIADALGHARSFDFVHS